MIQDIRVAVRDLARHRAFTITALAVLILGIAGNSIMFSLVNAFILKPLPYRDASRLVFIFAEQKQMGWRKR